MTTTQRSFNGSLGRGILYFAIVLMAALVMLVALPRPAYAAQTVTMKDGQRYDVGTFKTATWLTCDAGGTYYVAGSTTDTMLVIKVPQGQTATIIFATTTLAPQGDAPGAAWVDKAAITVEDTGGTVRLVSESAQTSQFVAQGDIPAICKNGTSTKLIFETENPASPGTFIARAAEKAYRTTAIGCDGSWNTVLRARTTGNMEFKSGNIEAYGSKGTTGGPGIGADCNSNVDGLLFSGANV
ncbi:MAG: hypothetical protein RR547_00245, partial [Raoultibacter sp.]